MLAADRPDDAVLSEEAGARGQSERRWILDPFDGTFNFVAGDNSWQLMSRPRSPVIPSSASSTASTPGRRSAGVGVRRARMQ
ncbi:MAG: inositol monophosphatase family protein [Egibacteraceae bacterium]